MCQWLVPSAAGSGGDAVRGLVPGRVGFVLSWGSGRLLVVGSWCQAGSSPPRWKVLECPGAWWPRPVVVHCWSPGNAVVLVGSNVPLIWLHAPAWGSACRPVMVPEPP